MPRRMTPINRRLPVFQHGTAMGIMAVAFKKETAPQPKRIRRARPCGLTPGRTAAVLLFCLFYNCIYNRPAVDRTKSEILHVRSDTVREKSSLKVDTPNVFSDSARKRTIDSAPSRRLIIGFRTPVITLNPYAAMDKESREVCDLVYAGLIGIDNNLDLVSELALGNPKTWNPIVTNKVRPELGVSLRENIRWHAQCSNKEPAFTSSDVLETWKYVTGRRSLPGGYKLSNIFDITTDGSNKLLVRFNSADQVTCRNFNFKILSANLLSSGEKARGLGVDQCSSIGTGPYKITQWDKVTNDIELEYADNGLLEKTPCIRHISIKVNPDEQTRAMDLQQHNIDLITDLPAQYAWQLSKKPGITVLNYPSVELSGLFFNYRPEKGARINPNFNLFHNLRFRRALDLAIDKMGIYAATFQDEGAYPGITGPFLPGGVYNPEVTDFRWSDADYSSLTKEWRKEEARKLLWGVFNISDTGAEKVLRLRLDLIYLSAEGGENYNESTARLIAFEWKALGIEVNRIPLKKVDYYERLRKGDYDLALYEWTSRFCPSIAMWEPRGDDGKGNLTNPANFCGYRYYGKNGREYSNAIETVNYGRRDAEGIRRAYHFIHEQLHEETAAIFLWNRNLHIAYNSVFKPERIKDPYNFIASIASWKCQ
jgi:ABC-type transport system substrate-binding protein